MRTHNLHILLFLLVFTAIAQQGLAQNYVRLRSGRTIACAVLSQDTTAIYTTDWDLRALLQPPMQVYTRDEVESIWFVSPTTSRVREYYAPHTSGLEGGGAVAFQTWAETELARRHLLILSLHGGLTVVRQGGLELDGDFTLPLSGRSDPVWRKYEPCYQVVMNVIVHPFVLKNGMVPFILGGGGASVGVPVGDVILSSSTDIRNLVDVGVGIKWGSNGLGYRLEWRHHFYTWTPDKTTDPNSTVRASEQTADASVIRATLFLYR